MSTASVEPEAASSATSSVDPCPVHRTKTAEPWAGVSVGPASRRRSVPSGRTAHTWVCSPPPGETRTASHSPSGDQSTLPTGSGPVSITRASGTRAGGTE